MRISPINSYSNVKFKGYDARKLKSIAITEVGLNYKIAEQLDEVAKKNDFELEILNDNKLRPLSYCYEVIPKEEYKIPEGYVDVTTLKLPKNVKVVIEKSEPKTRGFKKSTNTILWAQDIATVTPSKKILVNCTWNTLGKNIAEKYDLKYFPGSVSHISGGNLFFVKNDSAEELLVGNNEKYRFKNRLQKMKEDFGVENIIFIPQMDYHLDLFIRPLNNKQILVADDEMSLKMLSEGIAVYSDAALVAKDMEELSVLRNAVNKLSDRQEMLKKTIKSNNRPAYKDVAKVLEGNGFEPIPVPGRVYYESGEDVVNLTNYMNAILSLNKNDEIVYITNKSTLDDKIGITKEMEKKYGFSTEKYFKDSISKYVKPENIYFISGENNSIADNLTRLAGGVHCLACEIPQ